MPPDDAETVEPEVKEENGSPEPHRIGDPQGVLGDDRERSPGTGRNGEAKTGPDEADLPLCGALLPTFRCEMHKRAPKDCRANDLQMCNYGTCLATCLTGSRPSEQAPFVLMREAGLRLRGGEPYEPYPRNSDEACDLP